MAIFGLTTFKDIVDAVIEELKLSPDDTPEINRLKRDVNMAYVNIVAPAKRWNWLSGFTSIEFKPYFSDGTVAVTPDSSTITFSVPPSTSKAGYLFSTEQYGEIYEITSHVAGEATATIASPYTGSLGTAVRFRVWTDILPLPLDCRETVEVYHAFFGTPMIPVGLQEMRRIVAENPKLTGRPRYYATYDYTEGPESERYRVMRVYPSLFENSTTIKVDYTKEVLPLEFDEDEPIMPIEDRIALVYAVCERAWKRLGDTNSSEQSRRDFEQKLARMMGRVEDSQDTPQLTPNSRYLAGKRGRNSSDSRRATPGGSGSYNSPTYIKAATIEGANVTANITANAGITIDGVDISVLKSDFDAHIVDAEDAHDASAISVIPSGGILSTDVQTALQELDAEVTSITSLAENNIFIGNASSEAISTAVTGDISIVSSGDVQISAGVIVDADINSAAAISVSKIAALTAAKAVATDGAGILTTVNASASELNFLVDTEALQQLALNDNQAAAATIDSWAHASYDSFVIKYSLKRGAANKEVGTLMIATDGTDASVAQAASSLGTLGVTFSVDVSGANVRLRYTSTSTGVAPTISWRIEKWLA